MSEDDRDDIGSPWTLLGESKEEEKDCNLENSVQSFYGHVTCSRSDFLRRSESLIYKCDRSVGDLRNLVTVRRVSGLYKPNKRWN